MMHVFLKLQDGDGEVEGEQHMDRNHCCSRGEEKESTSESVRV
jgi:hypothetical protein